jgi:hypothetical protein
MIAHLNFNELLQVVQNSGGVELTAGAWSQEQRIQLASNAAQSGARLVFHGSSAMSKNDMLQVASNGKGSVVFT